MWVGGKKRRRSCHYCSGVSSDPATKCTTHTKKQHHHFIIIIIHGLVQLLQGGWYQKWQYILDKSSPQIALRWSLMAAATFAYALRVYLLNGWYIVTYGLGIYLLNQLIGFLSPQVSMVRTSCSTVLSLFFVVILLLQVWSWGKWWRHGSSN